MKVLPVLGMFTIALVSLMVGIVFVELKQTPYSVASGFEVNVSAILNPVAVGLLTPNDTMTGSPPDGVVPSPR